MNGFDAGGMGFDFLEVLALDHSAVYPILLATLIDTLQGRQLGFAGGDNNFAANLILNPFRSTKRLHGLLASAAINGLERTRLIVNAGMEHARIMPRLVLCQLRFLFEYHDTTLGKPLCQVVSGCEPDNPPTNDGHVCLLHGLSPQPPSQVPPPHLIEPRVTYTA